MPLVIKSKPMVLYTRVGRTDTPVQMDRSIRGGICDWLLGNKPQPWPDDVVLTGTEAVELLEEIGPRAPALRAEWL